MSSLADYNFDLPDKLIARYPLEQRDGSRLLVFDKQTEAIQHKNFLDLPQLLQEGDILVRNNSKVLPARFFVNSPDGARIEILLIEAQNDDKTLWSLKAKPAKRIKAGKFYQSDNGIELEFKREQDNIYVLFKTAADLDSILEDCGQMPIPPYFQREAEEIDKNRYQTIYADETKQSSIAAPTAGLHFTEDIFKGLEKKGIEVVDTTLHVGLGTFEPIRENDYKKHKMHSEYFEITENNWQKIIQAKAAGRRIIAIGSTSTRVLESAASFNQLQGKTDIYIYPGYEFKLVDAMITNFHLPKSSLILMISAFLGRENVMAIYQAAINNKYRFYSYGDCSLLFR